MATRTLSAMDTRKLLAHAKAIQAILAPRPQEPADHGVGTFLHDHTVTAPGSRMPLRSLHAAYDTWARSRGREPLPVRRFAKHVPGGRQKAHGTVYLLDIQLR